MSHQKHSHPLIIGLYTIPAQHKNLKDHKEALFEWSVTAARFFIPFSVAHWFLLRGIQLTAVQRFSYSTHDDPCYVKDIPEGNIYP
jgi:hypothetical protein